MQVSNKAVCDFKGKILTEKNNEPLRQTARILLSKKELLLVLNNSKHRIPIDNITSTRARVTNSPFEGLFGQGVIIRYYNSNKARRVVIGGYARDIAAFRMELFRVLIGEPKLIVKHPYKIGGVVKSTSGKQGKIMLKCINRGYAQNNSEKRLNINKSCLKIQINDIDISIPVSGVVSVEKTLQDIGPHSDCPTLIVEYLKGQEVYTTQLATPDKQKLRLLSQYFRQEYAQTEETINEIEITDAEAKALTEIYTSGGLTESEQVLSNIQPLFERNLIELKNGSISVTHLGRVWVNKEAPDRY